MLCIRLLSHPKPFWEKKESFDVNLFWCNPFLILILFTVCQSLITISPYGGYLGKTNFSYADVLCGLVKLKEIKTC